MTARSARLTVLAVAGVATLVLAASGCPGDGSALGGGGTGGIQPTLPSLQEHVFGAICINCHVPGGPGDFMLLDTEEHTYQNLVDVPSLFYFTPKIWHATHIFLFPRHNIMQSDETPFANEGRVRGKVGFHALIAMIAVDEKKIERLAAKQLLYPGESLRSLGVRAQRVNFLPCLA